MDIINYGFGSEYLPKWSIKEALREIYQNYLDYGDYEISTKVNKKDKTLINVSISNSYIPNKLEFLRIGNSNKGNNKDAIGSHGEGLKMAFLIFLRENLKICIYSNKYKLYPKYTKDVNVGNTLGIIYEVHGINLNVFKTEFTCKESDYIDFVKDIIQPEDILFNDNYHGQVVNKEQGNIYSGRLFVCYLDNISRAYNIPPSQLPLDRDRAMPRTWDINYHTSKINELYSRWSVKDTNYSDTLYIDNIPKHIKEQFTPKLIGNAIEFTREDEEGNTVVLKNDSIKNSLMQDSYFTSIIKSIKAFIARKLGLYEMLLEFEQKHVHTTEAKQDFELILERIKPY